MRHTRTYFRTLRLGLQARRTLRQHGLAFACEALFHLNRHARATGGEREVIYALKNHFVRELCRRLPHEAYLHRQRHDCWSCDGTGYHWSGGDCWRCDGTGVYRQTLLYVFSFVVDGRRYTWHQPKDLVDWPVTETPCCASEMPDLARDPSMYLDPKTRERYKALVYHQLRRWGVPRAKLPAPPGLLASLRRDMQPWLEPFRAEVDANGVHVGFEPDVDPWNTQYFVNPDDPRDEVPVYGEWARFADLAAANLPGTLPLALAIDQADRDGYREYDGMDDYDDDAWQVSDFDDEPYEEEAYP